VALASVMTASDHGDPVAVDLLVQSGGVIGRLLGNLVGLFNPAVIVVGGTMSTNEVLISAVRRAVFEWAQPLATRELRIVRSTSQEDAAGRGAVYSVLDTLFTPRNLPAWWEDHSTARGPAVPAH
jgi:predicted NBD/HSP70 family sugar kinase